MILITGGSGLVGAHLLLALNREIKEELRAIYRDENSLKKAKYIFSLYGKEAIFNQIEWFKADLLDIFSLDDAMQGVQKVIHCGAVVSFATKDAKWVKKVNIEGTANLVNACISANVKKIVYISSVAALGDAKNDECITEKHDWIKTKTTSTYSISKHYAENEIWRASAEGINVNVINPSTIIGPGDWNNGSPALFNRIYNGLKYYSTGSNGFISVNDVVKLIILLLQSDSNNQRYIANGENISFQTLFTQMAQALKVKPPQKKAPLFLGKFVLFFDTLKSKIFKTNAVLTKDSLRAAYGNKCYDNSKIKNTFDFEFEDLNLALQKTAAFYLSSVNR